MAGSIKIYVDLAGKDNVPHVFMGITNSAGATEYVGYGPTSHGSPIGKGQVFRGIENPVDPSKNAGNMDQVAWASGSIQVSDAQVATLLSRADYWEANPGMYVGAGFKHNCATFVKDLLSEGGVTYPYSGITDLPSSLIPSSELSNFYDGGGLNDKARHPDQYLDTPAGIYKQNGGPAIAPSNDITGYVEDPANHKITVTHQDGSVDVIADNGAGTQTATTTKLDGSVTVVEDAVNASWTLASETVTTTNAAHTQTTTAKDSNGDGTVDLTTTKLDADRNALAESTTTAVTGGDTTVSADANQNGSAETVTITHANAQTDVTQTDEGSAVWSVLQTHYDAQGRLDNQVIYNDDATSYFSDWDQTNASATALVTTYYDAQARLDSQTVTSDSGSYSIQDWDQANAYSWSSTSTYYTSGGAVGGQTVWSDSGTSSSWGSSDIDYTPHIVRLRTLHLLSSTTTTTITGIDEPTPGASVGQRRGNAALTSLRRSAASRPAGR